MWEGQKEESESDTQGFDLRKKKEEEYKLLLIDGGLKKNRWRILKEMLV